MFEPKTVFTVLTPSVEFPAHFEILSSTNYTVAVENALGETYTISPLAIAAAMRAGRLAVFRWPVHSTHQYLENDKCPVCRLSIREEGISQPCVTSVVEEFDRLTPTLAEHHDAVSCARCQQHLIPWLEEQRQSMPSNARTGLDILLNRLKGRLNAG